MLKEILEYLWILRLVFMQYVTFKLARGENFKITPNGYIRADRLLGFLLKYFASSSQAVQKFSSSLYKHNKPDMKNVCYFQLLI